MRLLFVGDVMGKSGRNTVLERLPGLRSRFGLDCIVVNGENAAGGAGITEKICQELIEAGADLHRPRAAYGAPGELARWHARTRRDAGRDKVRRPCARS